MTTLPKEVATLATGDFLKRFLEKFIRDETTTLAASLAFYSALSLAPLVILFIAVSAQLGEDLRGELLEQTRRIVGHEAAQAIAVVVENAKARTDLTSAAGLLGAGTLLLSASLIFGQLRTALNRIFNVPSESVPFAGVLGAFWTFVREWIVHILFAIVVIGGVIISLLASSYFNLFPGAIAPSHGHFPWVINVALSFVLYACLFTLVFRYMPDRRQPWRSAVRGGLLTATLFEVGKELIAVYLGRSAIGSSYGAAGSLIVLLVWVYYSTLITFIGAQVSALAWSSGWPPAATNRPG